MRTLRINHQEVYQEVWNRLIYQVENICEFSDVALVKLCARLGIPPLPGAIRLISKRVTSSVSRSVRKVSRTRILTITST